MERLPASRRKYPNNSESPDKPGYLFPGIFVRLRLPLEKKMAFVVRERALGTDLGGKYLLVLDQDNTVKRRGVEIGAQLEKEVGGVLLQYRVIAKGLKKNDRYIINGLQKAIPGSEVRPSESSELKPNDSKQSAS